MSIGLGSPQETAKCAKENGVEWHCIDPGKPRQNGFIEAFYDGLHDE